MATNKCSVFLDEFQQPIGPCMDVTMTGLQGRVGSMMLTVNTWFGRMLRSHPPIKQQTANKQTKKPDSMSTSCFD